VVAEVFDMSERSIPGTLPHPASSDSPVELLNEVLNSAYRRLTPAASDSTGEETPYGVLTSFHLREACEALLASEGRSPI
jgi:hypothetical protein